MSAANEAFSGQPKRWRGCWSVLIGLGLATLALAGAARAETLVYVQGYHGEASAWRDSGTAGRLRNDGWSDGGHLWLGPGGVRRAGGEPSGPRRFYTLDLPTEAPLLTQARVLADYLAFLQAAYPAQSVVLVGHSAGGVVARLYMVQYPDRPVAALITIASPHLGTESAEYGLIAGRSPLAWLAPLVGAQTLNRSQALYLDLAREHPGAVLYWLNRQPHPPARYVAIVRPDSGSLGGGDTWVPSYSQDMNAVPALRGRAERIEVRNGHALSAADGDAVARVLRRMGRS